MKIDQILGELKAERDRLDRAIAALEGAARGVAAPAKRGRRRRRHMSAEARRKIGAAMKKRWAERKRQQG